MFFAVIPGFSQSAQDFKKIDLVLSKMSERARREIVISDKAQFYKDLMVVLDAEKNYRSDDLGLYHLVDKKHSVGEYAPKELVPLVKNDFYSINRNDLSLRSDVEKALKIMSKAALQDGIRLLVSSSYRSYAYQEKVFARWVAIDGLEEAERESARPGTSQHQLGVAVDFGSITDDFAETPMGKWVYKNAAKYGWSLSFPKGYEDITGYRWECWHFRYIGVPACQMQKKWFCDVQQYMLEFIDFWKNS
ncbi:MAG: M15 family metallopeptidase [Treponema sp.]|nr:M15 family metallopeptidase [Treponema sp.]MBQ7754052.1 M15 family metallopeptidase [Treponema sp.]